MTALPAGASSSDGRRFISPQLVIYGAAWRREAGVRGTGPPELVHCPAPSCFTTQRAGLANLRWQTVTYITPRLADEDWWCFKGSVHTVDFSQVFHIAPRNLFFPSSFFVVLIFHASFFLFSLMSIYPCCPPVPASLPLPTLPLLSVCGCNVK